jgi:hypothetical protein
MGATKTAYLVWDEAKKQKLADLYVTQRLPIQDIADALSTSLVRVKSAVIRYGFKGRKPVFATRVVKDWDAESDAFLKTARAEGRSASQIARVLGVTKNAVIGRSDRIGLSQGGDEALLRNRRRHGQRLGWEARQARGFKVKAPRPKRAPLFPHRGLPASPLPLDPLTTFLDRTQTQCAEVMGAVRGLDTQCCGRPVVYRSFCAGHATVNYLVRR